jgi:hypothetical protein
LQDTKQEGDLHWHNFVEIRQLVQKLKGRTHTNTQHGDLVSLFSFLYPEEGKVGNKLGKIYALSGMRIMLVSYFHAEMSQ